MNNETTMKSAPCATRPLLTKVCRWVLTLGVLKIGLLVSLSVSPEPTLPLEARVDAALQNKHIKVNIAPTIRARVGIANAAELGPTPNRPQQAAPAPRVIPPTPPTPVTPQDPTAFVPRAPAPMPQLNVPAPQFPSTRQPSPFVADPRIAATPPSVAPAPSVPDYISQDTADRKQAELKRREKELLILQQQMQTRLDELKRVEDNMEGMLKQADTSQNDKLKHLIDVYANMKPKQAAAILATLDEQISVRILAGLKGKQAGQILGSMEPIAAANLSELLSRISFGN